MSELRRALTLAQMGLEQGMSIDGHIAANGPTLREVIKRALQRPDPPDSAIARLACEYIACCTHPDYGNSVQQKDIADAYAALRSAVLAGRQA